MATPTPTPTNTEDKEPMILRKIRLPRELNEALEVFAGQDDNDFTKQVRRAVREYVGRRKGA